MASPLTAEDRRELDAQLKALREVKAIINRAKAAGLDVEAQEAEADRLEKQLSGIKAQFFAAGG